MMLEGMCGPDAEMEIRSAVADANEEALIDLASDEGMVGETAREVLESYGYTIEISGGPHIKTISIRVPDGDE